MRLIFVVNYWHADAPLAKRLGKQIEMHYPGADQMYLRDVPRLKHILTGEWTQRYLEYALATGADVILKLDPDTCMWRRPEIPQADWFGTLSNDGFVRGGACGFSRFAAESLVSSGKLMRPTQHSYPRYGHCKWPHEDYDSAQLSCQDRTVSEIMGNLGIPATPWPDVLILGNDRVIPDRGDYSLTHPHPLIEEGG